MVLSNSLNFYFPMRKSPLTKFLSPYILFIYFWNHFRICSTNCGISVVSFFELRAWYEKWAKELGLVVTITAAILSDGASFLLLVLAMIGDFLALPDEIVNLEKECFDNQDYTAPPTPSDKQPNLICEVSMCGETFTGDKVRLVIHCYVCCSLSSSFFFLCHYTNSIWCEMTIRIF